MCVKIGIDIGPPPRQSVESFEQLLERADHYGFARIGIGDSQWQNMECFVALALAALHTKTAQIGPKVTNPVTREPSVMASAISSIDLISRGRAVLAIGSGDSALHNIGLAPASLGRMRAYVLALRELLEEGETVYEGRINRFIWPRSLEQRRIPICITAEGPRMLRLAGQIADEVLIGTGLLPEVVKSSLETVYNAAREVGRHPSEIEIWWAPRFSVARTTEIAIRNIKASLASVGNHAFRSGFDGKHVPTYLEESFRRLHKLYDYSQHGVIYGKNAALIDDLGLGEYLLERFAVVGTPEVVVERVRSLARLGAVNLWMTCMIDKSDSLDLSAKVLQLLKK